MKKGYEISFTFFVVLIFFLIIFIFLNQISKTNEKLLSEKSRTIFSNPSAPNDTLQAKYSFEYGTHKWIVTLDISKKEYHESKYEYRENTVNKKYVLENNSIILDLARQLKYILAEENSKCKTCIVSKFMENINYQNTEPGLWNHPKYPIETLYEKEGNCRDTSYLVASILLALNENATLLSTPTHMAVGVKSLDCKNSLLDKHNISWCYFETAGKNWQLGEIPKDINLKEIQIIDLSK